MFRKSFVLKPTWKHLFRINITFDGFVHLKTIQIYIFEKIMHSSATKFDQTSSNNSCSAIFVRNLYTELRIRGKHRSSVKPE